MSDDRAAYWAKFGEDGVTKWELPDGCWVERDRDGQVLAACKSEGHDIGAHEELKYASVPL